MSASSKDSSFERNALGFVSRDMASLASEASSAMTRRKMLSLSSKLLVTATCGLCSCRATSRGDKPTKPNIIVYLADALRADHLSCYGYSKKTSPFLDALSQQAYLFEQCRSLATWTRPSIASLYTGVSPRAHQMTVAREKGTPSSAKPALAADYMTLAESLEESGYDTALFLANPNGKVEFGFTQGFKHYRYVYDEDPGIQISALQSWITEEASEPFFAFVHCLDPHGPYRPPKQAYESLFGCSQDESLASLPKQDIEIFRGIDDFYLAVTLRRAKKKLPAHLEPISRVTHLRALLANLSKRGHDHFQDLYDAEIAYVDSQFANLFRFLGDCSLLDNTVVVFTSDHGEGFKEHGQYLHGHPTMLYDEQLHIPLLMWLPGVEDGKRIKTNVGLMDLHPTLLALAGAACPPYVQAQQLLNHSGTLIPNGDRPQMAWTNLGKDPDKADVSMVLGNFKLMTCNDDGSLKLFDLSSDPGEKVDLIEKGLVREDVLRPLQERFEREKQAEAELAAQFRRPNWVIPDSKSLKELKSLGYL